MERCYASVRRFVAKLRPKRADVTVRVHTGPGEEAQVDFGSAGKSQGIHPLEVFPPRVDHSYAQQGHSQRVERLCLRRREALWRRPMVRPTIARQSTNGPLSCSIEFSRRSLPAWFATHTIPSWSSVIT